MALKKSEQILLIASQIAEQRGIKERAARADVLECLGNFLIKRWHEKLGLAEEIAEAHRYILLGSANASLVFDALLTQLLYKISELEKFRNKSGGKPVVSVRKEMDGVVSLVTSLLGQTKIVGRFLSGR
ncbi:MAG: hypothetical protein R2688_08630 [Fimbriimonadaceae bacterium]